MPSIYAQSTGGGDFELAPAGNHAARCVGMIHLGTSEESYMGESKKLNKIRVTWELPEEMKVYKEGEPAKPCLVSKEYTLSMADKANLRKGLESWRGKGFSEEEAAKFDVTKLLGVPCLLNVIHKTSKSNRQYVDVSSITPIPKGMPIHDQITPNVVFSLIEFDQTVFNGFPDWLKAKIMKSDEYRAILNPQEKQAASQDDFESDTDLPF